MSTVVGTLFVRDTKDVDMVRETGIGTAAARA
jgi:hypothetical protein